MKKTIVVTVLSFMVTLASVPPMSVESTPLAQIRDPRDLRILVIIPETIIDARPPDPAAETEMIRELDEAGFSVLDPVSPDFRDSPEVLAAARSNNILLAQEIGRRFGVHVIIIGEALAQTAHRAGQLFVSSGRAEARAIRTDESIVVAANGFNASARDISSIIAGKAALQRAGGVLGDYLIAQTARHFNVRPRPRPIAPRVTTSVIRFTAPGLPPDIDFSTILKRHIVKLGTVDVIVDGQDLEALLSNGHAGVIPLPDVVLIGKVEKAEVVNLGSVCRFGVCLYLNRVTFAVSVFAVETETGKILGVCFREKIRHGLDVVINLGGITLAIFDRTLLGQLANDALEECAAEITSVVLTYLQPPSYFDITTMKSGNRMGRYITNQSFTIDDTDFGPLTFPTTEIASIVVNGNQSRLTLVTGELRTGRILDPHLMVSGLGTVPMDRVATIVLAIK